MRLVTVCLLLLVLSLCDAWGSDKVLLEDVKTLTLSSGKMTTGRRSAPVPQLTCVGGTAAGAFKPQVVQCYNRGTDGSDIQWECKTDMDNMYRFGQVEVTCEGYDYPDDPYILKGSCGLEYTLDYTKEGYEKQQGYQHDYYGQDQHVYHSKNKSSGFGTLVFLVGAGVVIYVIYRTCLKPSDEGQSRQGAYPSEAPPPYPGATHQPPPPGFRQEYMPSGDTSSSSGCAGSAGSPPGGTATGGGFWSGAATGGLLGYLFGSSNSRTHYHHRPSPGWGSSSSWGSGWGSGRGSGWGGSSWSSGSRSTPRSSGFSSGSTGTRTASGFGGTKRR